MEELGVAAGTKACPSQIGLACWPGLYVLLQTGTEQGGGDGEYSFVMFISFGVHLSELKI